MPIQFVTYSDLILHKNKMDDSRLRILKNNVAVSRDKDTFLSHSSKDVEYLPAVIDLLQNHGASVYCDMDDQELPAVPNSETANALKDKIRGSRKQVVFVTKNSKDSKWVPWELGFGDHCLNSENVALLPASENAGDQVWARQEYLGLYKHIVHGRMKGSNYPVWMVYDFRKNTATKLSEWFNTVECL